MKSFLVVALLLLAAPAPAGAQRSPAPAAGRAETRALPAFTAIDVSSGIELVVQPGQSPAAVVDASTAQLRRMTKTVVEGEVLKVYFDYQHEPGWQGLVNSHEVFRVVVTTTELRALTASNGSGVTLADGLAHGDARALTVQLRAGASLTGKVRAHQLDVQLREGATACLTGTAATLQVRALGGSNFKSPRLQVDQCVAFASSASTVRIGVRKTLVASAVNEATVAYSGPAELTQERHEQGGQIIHF